MSTFIQIHTLTSHSTHNLNRDDLGQPKSVEFLNGTHGRISSQALKRAIRNTMENELDGKTGRRTRQLPKLVKEHLLAHEVQEDLVKLMTQEIASLGKKDKAGADAEETQLIFLTLDEINTIKNEALEICQENDADKLTAKTKKAITGKVQALFKERRFSDGVDVAMFGRMTTSDVFENCDASVQVAHAITTHPIKNQEDFFTAVDDLGETGAGHMDEKYYSTGIFYKYATVNLDQLKNNLNNDAELAKKATVAFCNAFVSSLPTGSQNSMAAHQHPFTVLVTVGPGVNSNLANAFVDASRTPGNPLKVTTQALIEEFKSEQTFFGDLKAVEHAFLACQKSAYWETEAESTPSGFSQTFTALSEFWTSVASSIQEA